MFLPSVADAREITTFVITNLHIGFLLLVCSNWYSRSFAAMEGSCPVSILCDTNLDDICFDLTVIDHMLNCGSTSLFAFEGPHQK